jgi:AraC-like DNA-binding protein
MCPHRGDAACISGQQRPRRRPGLFVALYLGVTGEIRDAVGAERLGEAGFQLMASLVCIDVPARDLYSVSSRTSVTADALRARVHDFVRANLADPDLTHASVAAAHHVSARTLHRLFETEPHTVAEIIRLLRLEAIRRDLLNPNVSRRAPVKVVASRWGYADLSHLTRSFRAQYGITPGALRRTDQLR